MSKQREKSEILKQNYIRYCRLTTFTPQTLYILETMKLEAVILAAGYGSRMHALTRDKPKCLLPVGNQSLIWYAVTGLKSIGITRILVLISDEHENDIRQYCHKKFAAHKELVLEFVTVPSKAGRGTAESLYNIKEKIRGDFIVHSCDSLVDPKALSYLVNHYRLYDPLLTMLISDNPDYFKSRSVPGRQEKEKYMQDLIAADPLDKLVLTANEQFSTSRLVFIYPDVKQDENLRIRNRDLVLHPALGIHSSYLDAHVYIFKQEVFELIGQNLDKGVLKSEMVPLLVANQYRKKELTGDRLDDDEEYRKTSRQDYEVELRDKLESFHPRNIAQSPYLKKTSAPRPSACNALIVKNMIIHRANTLGTYLDCNREAKSILNTQGLEVVKECVVGEETIIGGKCTLKRGSVGARCRIGDKVKLFDCVIMDDVEIESNTTLSECIVGSNSKIGSKCDLKSCIVGYGQVVPNGRKSNSEVIADGYAIEI